MRRAINLIQILVLFFRVHKKWRTESPQEFQNWLLAERRKIKPFHLVDMPFYSLWISRFANWLFGSKACVLASSVAFLLAPHPVTLHFGVRNEKKFSSHAWTEWEGGLMQTDRSRSYEKIWEIQS